MAKKKAAIGDLIKSDMSKRAIGEEQKPVKEEKSLNTAIAASVIDKPAEKPVEKKPAAKPSLPTVSGGSSALAAFIMEQAQSVGLTDEADLRNYFDFLQSQVKRYTRGFDAGRRFHG